MIKCISISLLASCMLFSISLPAAGADKGNLAPPLVCDIRTQFLCIAAGNSKISLSELRGKRIWSVVDTDTGSLFRISEDIMCSDYVAEGSIMLKAAKKRLNINRFLHDSYHLIGENKCSYDVLYERDVEGKPSYSKTLSESQILFCRGWRDYDCKQRFDLASGFR